MKFKSKKILAVFMTVLLCIAAFPVSVSAADTAKYQTAEELVSKMTIGWNLGNTLDSWNNDGSKKLKNDVDYETCWGNPKTTKAMITAVKKAGFNTIRIPVTWTDHIDKNGKINADWLDRVQEVVDYAYDSGMFVIINTHHDESWIKFDSKNSAASLKKFTNVWKQIAARFKNYDQKLIFEGMNEPRTIGSATEWSGGTKSEWKAINSFYSSFVKTVRASGGNNKNRLLMLAPHAAKWYYDSASALTIPDDDMIAVSIHAYVPNSAAFDMSVKDNSFTENGKAEIDQVFEIIDEVFLSKGIPVVMGEFGTTNKSNTKVRAEIAKYYVSTAASYGVPCCWWDNGLTTTTGEGFAIFNRKTLKWYFADIVKALKSAAPKVSPDKSGSAEKSVTIGKKSYKTSMTGTLNLSGQGLKNEDIKNLKYMTNLKEIIISNNKITDLSVISNLTNLEKVTFHNNSVSDISFVKKLTKLKVFGAEGNGIKDISPLAGLKNLNEIWLSRNNISDISSLKNHTKLKRVSLSNNKLKSITALAKSTGIQDLYAENNNFNGNLNAIKGLTVNSDLYVGGNGFEVHTEEEVLDFINNQMYSDEDGFMFHW
ncbi:MAG: cellulase family glycosylhydrolase [Oscillospiraceae bacterium]|nr:cellulase family glycosylhydrolase [Oscillospiraceae bacterium]